MFGINGLLYIPDYISSAEETHLFKLINKQKWDNSLSRRVQHYGYRYDYKARTVMEDMYLGKLPKWLNDLAIQLKNDALCEEVSDQVIINEYQPGQGISAHIDCEKCFGPRIFSMSLGSRAVMDFTQEGKTKKEILLGRKSLVMIYGEARSIWKHSIPARLKDNGEEREVRISLTFRNVIKDF
ncbi:MAG: alpha-ketoglutarate-dependent dioxygenase AlkB [Ignavibacteria bacterium]|nr:alpha-ketoglutarate-dependent dioxygenase AlkB [Ignavibacteria bacterium]